ncbi:MAG: hypothetical protein GXO74_09020 [Calditrichaeota bacterium]|nr:hypothetical protein [Calditrichota bacterium]
MKLGKYYIDLFELIGEDFSRYQFDPNGVPLTRFPEKNWKYNPVTVCQYGLWQFNVGLRDDSERAFSNAAKQADWLVKNCRMDEAGGCIWQYQIDLPFYGMKAPWISGMAQAQAISLLLRMHQVTGEKRYLQTAEKAYSVFLRDTESGGVVTKFPDGSPVIEEYPTPKISAVLNGSIFSIFGVYDFATYFKDEDADQFFRNLIAGIEKNIHLYDSGFWSYYDLAKPRRLASKIYHRLHIAQLKELAKMSRNNLFWERAEVWAGYEKSFLCKLRWFGKKLQQKIFFRI